MIEAEPITLPGGFERDGAWQRSVWLRPLTGRDESLFAASSSSGWQAAGVTAVLARTVLVAPHGEALGGERASDLTVGDRDAALLHLRRITLGDRLSCVLTCPACDAKLDLDLQVTDLVVPPYAHTVRVHRIEVADGAHRYEVSFRLPTGADQEWATRLAVEDAAAAARAVLGRCVVAIADAAERPIHEIPPAVLESLPRAMADLDPQAEIVLQAHCPACEAEFSAPFDAAQFLWQEMRAEADAVLRDVHALAFHYGWSESEILALTRRRRRQYLALLAETLTADAVR